MNRSGYYKVGIFTIAGIALAVVLLITLSSSSLFKSYTYMETYFDQSVQGLSAGSPVLYRGVRLGSVSEVGLVRNQYAIDADGSAREARQSRYVYVKVHMEFPTSDRSGSERMVEILHREVEDGLRVRLAPQGITGLSVLVADYVDPAKNPGLPISWEPKHFYVPSASGTLVRVEEAIVDISAIVKELREIDYVEMGRSITEILERVETLVESLDLEVIRNDLTAIVDDFAAMTGRVREIVQSPEVAGIPERADAILADVQGAVGEFREMITRLSPKLDEMTEAAVGVSDDLERAILRIEELVGSEEVKEAIARLPEGTASFARVMRRLNALVATSEADLEQLASNLRRVSAHLEELTSNARRYPSQVLFGEPPPARRSKGE